MEETEYLALRGAEEHHWWYAGMHDLVLRRVGREAARAGRTLDILDAGCGTGGLSRRMQDYGTVTACDVHPAALAATRERGVACVLRLDVAADDLGCETFDVVCCVDVLYHLAVCSEAAALGRLHRALRPGGLLIVQVPAFEGLRGRHDAAVHTRHRYRRRELVALLHAAGFAVEWSSYRLPALALPAWIWRRLGRSPERRGAAPSDLARTSPRWLEGVLSGCVRFENRLLMAGWRFPFGTSVFAVARKIWCPPPGAAAFDHGL